MVLDVLKPNLNFATSKKVGFTSKIAKNLEILDLVSHFGLYLGNGADFDNR